MADSPIASPCAMPLAISAPGPTGLRLPPPARIFRRRPLKSLASTRVGGRCLRSSRENSGERSVHMSVYEAVTLTVGFSRAWSPSRATLA